jgi:hypothetical protein
MERGREKGGRAESLRRGAPGEAHCACEGRAAGRAGGLGLGWLGGVWELGPAFVMSRDDHVIETLVVKRGTCLSLMRWNQGTWVETTAIIIMMLSLLVDSC